MSCRSSWRLRAPSAYRPLGNSTSRLLLPLTLVPHIQSSIAFQSRCAHVGPDSKSRQVSKPNSTKSTLLNPPRTTLPPPLETPNREAFDSQFKYLFELGKGYVKFYKEGVKSVWGNRKLVKEKVERTPKDDRPSIFRPSYVPRTFSRADWVLLWRSRHDMLRLPFFGLMLVVIGEFTVLVVALVDGLVPYPCRIPSQIFHGQERAEARRKLAFEQLESQYPGGACDARLSKHAARNHVLRTLYLSGDSWEYLRVVPPGLWQIKGKLRMAFLEGDDKNLIQDGGPTGLNKEELRMACVDRGIDVLGQSETDMRASLGDWLRLTAAEDGLERRRRMTTLLLTR